MENKILIQLYVPMIEKEYDIFIPINKRIGTIKRLIEKNLNDNQEYIIREDSNLYSMDTGLPYDVQMLVKETDLRNASKIVLI